MAPSRGPTRCSASGPSPMPREPRPRPATSYVVAGSCPYGGVYVIENTLTGFFYVGSTKNLRRRWQLHRHLLRTGHHHSPYLQASWVKHGEEAFRFVPLCILEEESERLALEQHFINTLHPTYNVSPTANSCAGVKRSEATRAKMRAAVACPERREKFLRMARAPKSPEHRARISASHQGLHPSEETRAKLRAASARRWGKA